MLDRELGRANNLFTAYEFEALAKVDRGSFCHLCDFHLPIWIHNISAEFGKLYDHHFGGFPVFWNFAADLHESSCFLGFLLVKRLHGVSISMEFPVGNICLQLRLPTDSLNALRSLRHDPGLSTWLWYVWSFAINVEKKNMDGLLSQCTDDTKMVSPMNMIRRESDYKKPKPTN